MLNTLDQETFGTYTIINKNIDFCCFKTNSLVHCATYYGFEVPGDPRPQHPPGEIQHTHLDLIYREVLLKQQVYQFDLIKCRFLTIRTRIRTLPKYPNFYEPEPEPKVSNISSSNTHIIFYVIIEISDKVRFKIQCTVCTKISLNYIIISPKNNGVLKLLSLSK